MEWISVKERMPEKFQLVIGFCKSNYYPIDILEYRPNEQTEESWLASDDTLLSEYDVTHWMPLPEPPKE